LEGGFSDKDGSYSKDDAMPDSQSLMDIEQLIQDHATTEVQGALVEGILKWGIT
jgi:hypothetical protein